MMRSKPAICRALTHPACFSSLLFYLGWSDLHALLDCSTFTRRLFHHPTLCDLILARFLPGFVPNRPRPPHHLSLSIYDFHLFILSQTYPLHRYPTHALRSFFSTHPLDLTLDRLSALALAHSRLVLLLQSLVHFSPPLAIPPEPQGPHLRDKLSPSLPHLSFPAPLSYSSPPSSPDHSPSKSPYKNGRRLTQLLRSHSPAPPPPREPRDLQSLSSSWRRSRHPHPTSPETLSYSGSSDPDFVPPQRPYVTPPSTSTSSFYSRPSLASRPSTSSSSTQTPPTSSSPSPSPPPDEIFHPVASSPHDLTHATSPTRAPVLRVYVPCPSQDLSVHSPAIAHAEEQLARAGLWSHLSVGDIVCNFGHVPLDDSDRDISQARSEKSSGRHLTVPRTHPRKPQTHPANWLIFNGTYLVPFSASEPLPVGDALSLPSPFYYTHILPRSANPIFFLRQMPPFKSVSLRVSVSQPQRFKRPQPSSLKKGSKTRHLHHRHSQPDLSEGNKNAVDMRLVNLPSKVPTSYGGGGGALVRRYAWIARVHVNPADLANRRDDLEVGPGWHGEWTLEGEGTTEGKEDLMDWLGGGVRQFPGNNKENQKESEARSDGWKWELVRERCSPGRIWLKLLEGQRRGNVVLDGDQGPDRLGFASLFTTRSHS